VNFPPPSVPVPRVSKTLKAAEPGEQEHLFRRGKRGTFWFRRRIPTDLVGIYKPKGCRGKATTPKEVSGSLRTTDRALAKSRLYVQLAKLEADFARCRSRLTSMPGMPAVQPLTMLSDVVLDSLAATWLGSMLHCDEQQRRAGLDDEAFDAMGAELAVARADLGKLLARGQVEPILPAFRTLLSLHRYDAALDDEALRDGAYRLLRTVVSSLDMRLQRHDGIDVPTPVTPVALPATGTAATWDECLEAWKKLSPDLSLETFYSVQTAWRSLREFANGQGVPSPGLVTREVVIACVNAEVNLTHFAALSPK
jgi:hypothetical protein